MKKHSLGLRVMNKRLQDCDCVLEIHDARIPFSGRNPKFSQMVARRPKILVLNKMDMADSGESQEMTELLQRSGEREIVYTDSHSQHHHSIEELMQRIKSVSNFDAEDAEERPESIKLMLMGIPNVGKSSLINALRRRYIKKGKATRVGATPGITRGVLGKISVSDDPKMFILDTPGVMTPSIPSAEVAMKLALVGTLPDHFVGERVIVDYLLYKLNQSHLYRYVDFYKLPEPCDDIHAVLDSVGKRIGALTRGGIYDHHRTARHFLQMYRDGKLGTMTLDTH
jgi:ribosome biogenesis GTPase A